MHVYLSQRASKQSMFVRLVWSFVRSERYGIYIVSLKNIPVRWLPTHLHMHGNSKGPTTYVTCVRCTSSLHDIFDIQSRRG